jgi:hypothetical protein
MKDAHVDHWDSCLTNGGKFVEAVLKCFHYLRTGVEIDTVKVDEEVRLLEQTTSLNDFERLTIPRALRLIYEFRNRRGGAHNNSFDPIKMDCASVVANSKWVVEELTRLYLTNDAIAAQTLVDGLLVRDTVLVEEIDGDRLVLRPGLSARVQLEIIMWREPAKRFSFKDLTRWVHNHTTTNISSTLYKMKKDNLAHQTEEGWKLTDLGMRQAEEEIVKLLNDPIGTTTVSKSKTKGTRRGRK